MCRRLSHRFVSISFLNAYTFVSFGWLEAGQTDARRNEARDDLEHRDARECGGSTPLSKARLDSPSSDVV
jgi:hypothetical protein